MAESKVFLQEQPFAGVLWKSYFENFTNLFSRNLKSHKSLFEKENAENDTPAQVYSYHFCKILQNSDFAEQLWETVSILTMTVEWTKSTCHIDYMSSCKRTSSNPQKRHRNHNPCTWGKWLPDTGYQNTALRNKYNKHSTKNEVSH